MMRYLLTLAFVLLAAPCFAQTPETWVIQEDGGGDYTTVQAAETAQQQDLTSTDKKLTFEIRGTWTSADGNGLWSGWTNDATRFPTLTAVGAARATATWSNTAFRAVGNAPINTNTCTHIVFDGLQAKVNSSSDIAINGATNTNIVVKNCFVSGDNQTSSRGIIINGSTASGVIFRNNVIIDCLLEGIFVVAAATGGVKMDNNTIENCGDGIETSANDGIARNNILWNCTNPLVGDFNTTTLSEENYTDAVSLDYGSCGSCGTGDQFEEPDPFVSLGGENYHLASGATAIDAGKDLSADFTDAIGGKTRTDGFFDKGADEFIAAAAGKRVLIRKAMMFWVW